MNRSLRTLALTAALALGVWTLAVTFTPIASNFAAGGEVSASAFNDLFAAVDANFDIAATAIAANEDAIAALQSSGGLTLPFDGTVDAADPAFALRNSGTGSVLNLDAAGAGRILEFSDAGDEVGFIANNGAIRTEAGLNASSANAGFPAVIGSNTGGGRGGSFTATGVGSAVFGSTDGTGRAGDFQVDNASNGEAALFASHVGTGPGLRVQHTGAGRLAEFTSDGDSVFEVANNGAVRTEGGLNASSDNVSFPAVTGSNTAGGRGGSFTATGVGSAVFGRTTGTGRAGDFQIDNTGSGNAALFASTNGTGSAILAQGDVTVNGNLEVTGTKNFRIDHPLEPETMVLNHYAIESDEVSNVYSGNVVLDADGAAMVELPRWFGALNRDVRYQLTAIGAPAPELHIARPVEDGRFAVAGGAPGMTVSWQLTGVRSDRSAQLHARPVEEPKVGDEVGRYLDPHAYGVEVAGGD